MIDILLSFIKAERTGNWTLHLQALSDMLPYFAASGHNLYAKTVYLYLQFMSELESTHPSAYVHFSEDFMSSGAVTDFGLVYLQILL